MFSSDVKTGFRTSLYQKRALEHYVSGIIKRLDRLALMATGMLDRSKVADICRAEENLSTCD